MIDFRVFLSASVLFIAVLVNIIAFKTFIFISFSILCSIVLFEKWSTDGLRAGERQRKKRKNDVKEQLTTTNGILSNMFFNRSFQEKSKVNNNNASSKRNSFLISQIRTKSFRPKFMIIVNAI